jgi:hypothetical protein
MLKHYSSISHTYDNEHFLLDFLSLDITAFQQNAPQVKVINSVSLDGTGKCRSVVKQ